MMLILTLFGLIYGGFGLFSPYLPALLAARGLDAQTIGFALAAGTLVKLVVSPPLARFADRRQRVAAILAAALLASSLAAAAYGAQVAGLPLVALTLAQAAALAPAAPFADAIAVSAAERSNFPYGVARGTGSAAFVAGALASGALVTALGWTAAAYAQAGLLLAAGFLALRAPEPTALAAAPSTDSWRDLLAIRPFRQIMAIAALILGSHALHDGFALIAWTKAGVSPRIAAFLWSEGVIAEIVVFFALGPWLLARLGARGALALAVAAAVLRWTVMAFTTAPAVMAFTEPLHGLTFALLHLACMGVIARNVPADLAASAQALYGAVAVGAANAALTAASGAIFARYGAHGFAFMAALCLLAAPFIWTLREKPAI